MTSLPDEHPARTTRRGRDASERTARKVRSYIEQKGLGPGSRVGTEHELAREFGVSRATLREALKLLSASHLVEATTGRNGGIFVVSPPIEGIGRSLADSMAKILETGSVTLDELLQVRLFTEAPLAGLAARHATHEAIDELRRAVEDAEGNQPGSVEFNSADRRFHQSIARSVGNDLLTALSSWIIDVLEPTLVDFIGPNVDGDNIIRQHGAILDAIRKGDAHGAELAMTVHIEHLREVAAAVAAENSRQAGD